MRNSLLASLLLAAAAAPAAADPGFLSLDRQDGQSRVGGEVSYLVLDDALEDITALRIDVHGQYVTPAGIGFYAAMPISYASGDGDSATGLGNVEVGAIFLPRFANPNVTLALHGGLTLPTASDDEDAIANAVAIGARFTDLALIIPDGLSLRLAASPMLRSGQVFAKLDAGLDINLAQRGDGTTDPLVRINLGAGYDFGGASLTGELTNLFSTDDDVDNSSVSIFSVGVRAVAGNLRPYGGISIPLDGDDTAADFALTAGFEGVIQ